MTDTERWLPCPNCKLSRFVVKHDAKAGRARVICDNCGATLLEVEMVAPLEPRNTQVPI